MAAFLLARMGLQSSCLPLGAATVATTAVGVSTATTGRRHTTCHRIRIREITRTALPSVRTRMTMTVATIVAMSGERFSPSAHNS